MLCHAISDSTEQGRGRVPATTSCRHQKTTLQMSRDRENTGIPASAGVEMTERNIDRPGCVSLLIQEELRQRGGDREQGREVGRYQPGEKAPSQPGVAAPEE